MWCMICLIWVSFKILGIIRTLSIQTPVITSVLKNRFVRKLGKKVPPQLARPIVKQLVDSSAEKPKISNEDLKQLQEYYCNDVLNLEKTLHQDLPWNTTKIS